MSDQKNVFQRLLQILFQWVSHLPLHSKNVSKILKKQRFLSGINKNIDLSAEGTVLKDWMKAIETFHPIVRKRQLEIDLLETQDLTVDLLGASTYLLQIDILLSKNKKYLQSYERRERDFNDIEKESHLEFLRVSILCKEVHQTVLHLMELIRDVPLSRFDNKEIVKIARLLEKQTRETAGAMQTLNDAVLKKGPLYQLFENDLFKALYEIEQSHAQLKPYFYSPLKESTSTVLSSLRDKAQAIKEPELKMIAMGLINQYEALNKYMIFSSSEVLSKGFRVFYSQVENFIQEASGSDNKDNKADDQVLHQILDDVFGAIESIRFIANKKDSFAKNLQDAARSTTKQLRKHLEKTQKGQNFLNSHRMTPKEKLSMKGRFK